MGKPAKVGLVTVTFNSAKVIDDFMKCALELNHQAFVLYVIDNKSSDNTLGRLGKYKDSRVVLIANDINVGVAAGNNQGIKASLDSNCDFVLLINNDVEFEKGLIEKLLIGSAEHDSDIIVPKILYFNPPDKIWYAGGKLVPWLAYQEKHIGEGETDLGQYDLATPATYSPTCCMLIKGSVFHRIGLMDEKYFVYYDDTDFCFRVNRAGIRMTYIPNVQFYHKTGSLTGGANSPFSIKFGTRNKVYFVKKNLGILAPIFLILYQILIISRILKRKDWNLYKLQMRSFYQGMKL